MKQAEADLAIIASREAKISPQDYPTRFTVQLRSLTEMVTGRFQSILLTALAGVALLLLIGCGNVANLMLAPRYRPRKGIRPAAPFWAPAVHASSASFCSKVCFWPWAVPRSGP